jgi:hypothetical protein
MTTHSIHASPEKSKVQKPSLAGSKGYRSHSRNLKVLPWKSRAGFQLPASAVEDAFLPSKLGHQDDDNQESRTKAEVEELTVFKRVHLTGKDLLNYRFGFSSSKTPNPSPPPSFGLNLSAHQTMTIRVIGNRYLTLLVSNAPKTLLFISPLQSSKSRGTLS